MAPTRPLALLFDLDGTLADSIGLLLDSFHHAFATCGIRPPSDEQWIAGIGTPLVAQMRSHVADDAMVAALLEAYRTHQRAHHDHLLREFPAARETLQLLKARGHPTALVTSKSNELAHRSLAALQMTALMDAVVGFDSCERHKPDREPVELALRTLGAAASDAVFIGDSPHDITAGNAAGVMTIAALWGPFPRAVVEAAHPTYMLHDIRALPPLIAELGAANGGGSSRQEGQAG
ncbi:MAG TPA: HAD-IA family hydrolase [Gemmatimonadaceae bacterium]|nr:HAD-IA family hydrolase [Gemmatimonadaceae bacterium]